MRRIRGFYSEDAVMVIAIIVFVAVLILAVVSSIREHREWEAFRVAHACKVVGQMDGSTSVGYGVGSNGQAGVVTTSTPGKTGFQCDDGVTYWRNK